MAKKKNNQSRKKSQKKPSKRNSLIKRKTRETDIGLNLVVDGQGNAKIRTPVAFLNHMLEGFARHGLFDLEIQAQGDVEIDDHHTVEDVGICLGKGFQEALGDKFGIRRYGWCILPFDEVLVSASIDLCGRPTCVYRTPLKSGRVGGFEVELIQEFFQAFTNSCGLSLHLEVHYGRNRHHMIEALFKAFARALDQATEIDPRVTSIPSTKGKL
jgi:imidazoleglycerol-phosphate dehydratase